MSSTPIFHATRNSLNLHVHLLMDAPVSDIEYLIIEAVYKQTISNQTKFKILELINDERQESGQNRQSEQTEATSEDSSQNCRQDNTCSTCESTSNSRPETSSPQSSIDKFKHTATTMLQIILNSQDQDERTTAKIILLESLRRFA